jgi:hypothetical protein
MFSINSSPYLNDRKECTITNREQLSKLKDIKEPIETLIISFTLGDLYDEDIYNIMLYLKTTKNNTKNLWFVNSELTNEQAKSIIDALTEIDTLKSIEGLSFCSNDLQGDVCFLRNLKKLNGLIWLNLSENNLSMGIDDIIEIICNCPLLQELHLSASGIDDVALEKLCLSIEEHPSLTRISIDHNKLITDNSVKYIKELIEQNNRLKHVNLLGTKISDSNIYGLQAISTDVEIFFGKSSASRCQLLMA